MILSLLFFHPLYTAGGQAGTHFFLSFQGTANAENTFFKARGMEMEEKLYKERKKKLYKIGVDSIVTIEYRMKLQ
jgi:hypothetical protein